MRHRRADRLHGTLDRPRRGRGRRVAAARLDSRRCPPRRGSGHCAEPERARAAACLLPDIRNRVHVVGNGICEPPRLPRRPPKDTIDILYVGRFANRKGMVDLFEALAMGMSQGLAVVVTDAGGPAEIVDHGVTGLVVAPRRPAVLARRSWISAATRSCGCGSDEPRAGSWPSGTRAGRWYARWKRSTTRHAGRETSDERQRRGCSMRRNTFSVSRWSDGRTLLCAPSLLPPGASAHAQSIVPVAQTSAPERAR